MNNYLITLAERARNASIRLASATTEEKNKALSLIADRLEECADEIISANELDIKAGRDSGMSDSLIDRLMLNKDRIKGVANGVRDVIALPDPIGEVIEESTRPNGLHISRVRVPLGVIGMIYEARPNVTVDASVLSLKAGSASLLRGSASALNSNRKIAEIIRRAIGDSGLPEDSVSLIDSASHEIVDDMMALRGYIDLLIPRGGAGLIKRVVSGAKVPVLETGVGNCHIFVDDSADLEAVKNIIVNAKVQRPSVCNAAETLLIHEKLSESVPEILTALTDKGVTIHGCEKICKLFASAVPSVEKDYTDEYLSLDMAVKLVSGVNEAIEHIRKYGTGHTEAILTGNSENAELFKRSVDAACVNVNASTRFTDGFEFGFGAEIGISTQKMHARGPVGLREITSYKYIVEGNGQIRK